MLVVKCGFMKLLYSELKQFIPTIKSSPKAVGDALTMIGLMVESLEEVAIAGKKDWLICVEVRAASRPDCLGVLGIAREVAAHFGLPVQMPKFKFPPTTKKLVVNIKAGNDVHRVCVLQVDGLDNSKPSPSWLKESIEAHGMNSISFLVDISNYAMLMTGYPNHIFDAGKVVGGLLWERAPKNDTLTTLDGTVFELHKGKELVISDNLGPLVLASAVGGRRSAISERTTSVLSEVAVYDAVKVRTDARSLQVATEASNRLEKELSPEGVRFALEYLANVLVTVGGGRVTSNIFDSYPAQHRPKRKPISMLANMPSLVSGIEISVAETTRYLKRLGYSVRPVKNALAVIPPAWRSEVYGPRSVAEDVVRIKGFHTIKPVAPSLVPVPDVTPAHIRLADTLRTLLPSQGFDEALTLPMTTPSANADMLWEDLAAVRTQNAINEEFPVLRQGLAAGLIEQQHEYLRKEIFHIKLFEIGKVFGMHGKRYGESDRLGMLVQTDKGQPVVAELQYAVEQLLRTLGVVRISFEDLGRKPKLANPHAAWLILVAGKTVGVMYQLQKLSLSGNRVAPSTAFAEIDLLMLLEQLSHERPRGATELVQKLVVLDANVEATGRMELEQILANAQKQITRPYVWSFEVVDSYQLPGDKFRFTVRVSYQNLSDSDAKELHEKVFGLSEQAGAIE